MAVGQKSRLWQIYTDNSMHGPMDVADTLVVNQQNKSVEYSAHVRMAVEKWSDRMLSKIVKATYNNDHKITILISN